MYSIPSCMWIWSLGSESPEVRWGRYLLLTSTTCCKRDRHKMTLKSISLLGSSYPTSSISQRWALSTHLCLRTSLIIPPSPPPTTSTCIDGRQKHLSKALHAIELHVISATVPSLDQDGRTREYGWGTRDRQTHLSRCIGWLHPAQGRCQKFCCGGNKHIRQRYQIPFMLICYSCSILLLSRYHLIPATSMHTHKGWPNDVGAGHYP